MEESEAVELLMKRAKQDTEANSSREAERIVHRLGYHALAIDQAGAYILKRKLKLEKFLHHFSAREELILKDVPKTALWEYRRRLNDEEKETSLSVFTSWELSYQQLLPDTEEGHMKSHLLTLFAFLHGQGVSEKIFWAHNKAIQDDEDPAWLNAFIDGDGDWDHFSFEDVLVELRDLSLILDYTEVDEAICTVTLHPLVRDWIKLRLTTEQRREYTIEATSMVHNLLLSHRNVVEAFDMGLELKSEALS